MTTILKNYIRDNNRNPQGVVVLIRHKDHYRFGYSLCSPNDKFDKQLGTKIATRRADLPSLAKDEALAPLVPDRRRKVLDAYMHLEKRAAKYFKTIDA